jgi:aminopeptidase N
MALWQFLNGSDKEIAPDRHLSIADDMTSYSLCFNTTYTPSNYVLYLDPDIHVSIFSGAETITFRKNSDSPFSDLFADLFIAVASVTQSGWPLRHTYISTRHCIFGADLSSSSIRIEFRGSLAQNSVSWCLISGRCPTFFEAMHVRAAFPCFDAQSVKNRFKITIIVPREAPGHPEVADVVEEGEEGSEGGQATRQAHERFDQIAESDQCARPARVWDRGPRYTVSRSIIKFN